MDIQGRRSADWPDRVNLEIQGKGAFSRLKYERGFHPVQRVMDGGLDELVDALGSHAPAQLLGYRIVWTRPCRPRKPR